MNKSNKNDLLSLYNNLSKALFLGVGISNIFTKSKESAFISIILGFILGEILLYIIYKLKLNKNNKIIKFIIIYILFLIGIVEFINLISSIYLIDTNKFIIIIPLIIVILYLNTKNIETHLKLSNILLYISEFIILLSFIFLFKNIKLSYYFPLINSTLKNIIISSLEYAIYLTIPTILIKEFNYDINFKTINKRYIYSNITLIFIILTTQGILGVEIIDLFKYPEYIVLKKIDILDFINDIENIASICWVFIMFIYLSICSKEMYDIVYKKYNNKFIYPIFITISLFIFSTYFLDNIIYLLLFYKYLWIILYIILFIYIVINIKIK